MICQTNSIDRPEQNILTARSNFEQQLRVVAKLQITPVAIVHSEYEPLTIPERYRNYLEQMSIADRDRYFAAKLQQYLYAIFNGDLQPKHSTTKTNSLTDSDEEMVNYGDRWYETKFYHQLTQCNHSRGYSDSNWLIVEREAECWQVSKNGLTLHINPEIHLVDPTLKLQVGQTVSIKMPPSLVDRGLYVAVGDAGSANNCELPVESNVVQLYFNVSAEVALRLLDYLTQRLNTLKIPFDFKVAYNEAAFERQDAAVLEFMSQDWTRLKPVLETVYSENRSGFQTETPFFCKHLASGLGLAEKPNMGSHCQQNIGQQHCSIIAKALVKVCKHIEAHTLLYLKELGINLSKIDLYIQRAWPVVSRPDQSVGPHAHYTSHVSAVYYVSVPENDTPKSGSFIIHNSSNMNEFIPGIGGEHTDAIDKWNPFNYKVGYYSPKEGRVLIFPSKQMHGVGANQTGDTRISLSFDIVITSANTGDPSLHEFLSPPPNMWKKIEKQPSSATTSKESSSK